ncbi:MAG: hypothetical protein U0U33_14875 [Chitinophagaceae bacterium]
MAAKDSTLLAAGDCFLPHPLVGCLPKEKFLENSKWLTNLKLRLSYGLTGDQEISSFQYQGFWTPGRYDGYSGLRPRNLGNTDLTWQRNKMFNFGADFEILKGKIGGSLEVFKGNKANLAQSLYYLLRRAFPPSPLTQVKYKTRV